MPLERQIFNTRLYQVGVDEADKVAQSSVDTSEAGLGTALAPGNNTLEDAVGIDDGAAAVALAGVLAALGQAGAEHVVGDDAVLGLASGAGDDGDGDLVESGGERVGALGGGAPVAMVRELEFSTNGISYEDVAYQPAVVKVEPAAGSEPEAGRVA